MALIKTMKVCKRHFKGIQDEIENSSILKNGIEKITSRQKNTSIPLSGCKKPKNTLTARDFDLKPCFPLGHAESSVHGGDNDKHCQVRKGPRPSAEIDAAVLPGTPSFLGLVFRSHQAHPAVISIPPANFSFRNG